MSTVYHTEPPTSGKALIHTTFGDIDIELWSKEAPLACRNFIQLSLEGYYDKTPVNRVIKDFMVQMGIQRALDRAEILFGSDLLKMKFTGESNSTTEVKLQWQMKTNLTRIEVTGNTFYNLSRVGDAEVDSSDRPTDSIFITSVEILVNPFDDIIPRDLKKNVEATLRVDDKKGVLREGKRDLKLLSFGDDAEEEVELPAAKNARIKSIHDVDSRDTSRYSSEIAPDLISIKSSSNDSKQDSRESERSNDRSKNSKSGTMGRKRDNEYTNNMQNTDEENRRIDDSTTQERDPSKLDAEDDIQRVIDDHSKQFQSADKESKNTEYNRLLADTLKSRKAVKVLTGDAAVSLREEISNQKLLTPLELRRQRFISRKKEHGDRQGETLEKLQAFSSKIKSIKSIESREAKFVNSSSMYSESYQGQVLEDNDLGGGSGSNENVDSDKHWFAGKLKFRRHVDDDYRTGDGRRLDDYKLVDPRDARKG